jgi:UDP-N-acetylmuramoylalanine--D-glutamate ligase
MNLKNKNLAVVGLGVEGASSAVYLSRNNRVSVLDRKEEQGFDSEVISKLKDQKINLVLGSNYLDSLSDYDLILRSPGVKIETIKNALKEKSIPITSQTDIFLRESPCMVIGVTGTKGKGTTSALIYEMLKKSGIRSYLGGNIGTPPFEFLDNLKSSDRVVLELSSFQLQDITKSPQISVVLMITSEHLDYHKDQKEYIDAKRNILIHQTDKDIAIINRDYPPSNESDVYTNGNIFKITTERDGVDQGCYLKDNSIYVSMNQEEWKTQP